MTDALFIYSPNILKYRFNEHHPFNQTRIALTLDLLKKMNAINEEQIIQPRKATEEELALIHDPQYIQAVKLASLGQLSPGIAENYGLGTEDVPIFAGMHDASSYIVGGTLTAAELVMEEKVNHALNLSGGLHHGFKGKASGFCIYNDCAVAIKYIREKYNARVLYIDTDAHHGDGVQWSFYDDPNVCTLSIHETGRYLFPGTGAVTERGFGDGYGYSFNIPLDAFTEDESFLAAYSQAIEAIAEFFKPDVILTQNGADCHYYDPLTHLSCTINIYREIPKIAKKIARQYCDGRWIAVGGGGYDIWRVVPRAFALVWLQMTEYYDYPEKIPVSWLEKWQPQAPVPLPSTWSDVPDLYQEIPRKAEISEKNAQTVRKTLYPLQKSSI